MMLSFHMGWFYDRAFHCMAQYFCVLCFRHTRLLQNRMFGGSVGILHDGAV